MNLTGQHVNFERRAAAIVARAEGKGEREGGKGKVDGCM